MTKEEIEKLPELLTVDEARKIVNIGKTAMYELIRTNKDFPAVNLGARRTRIIKSDFLSWIKAKYQA
ncbi:helix-turn-helix domain-containing protein [Clostridium sp. SYSU_GA19001]|uniref:helix-turn-helix transcriptional regulator n=1 Tax=Clostridium caldaquaticum TaxID=2940653 RepID=UPI002077018D|nr:helix-turn-helix domain-containing protein [Clostridium caldaquaticum]MCM8710506.1 helix-turn-helix domain-containing protein [Clostridium caldaquaticum]